MYAPSPDPVNAAGSGAGIYNTSCDVVPHRNWCHGSLMNEQWWTLPRGARAAHIPSWRRPDGLRSIKAAPVDEIMYPQPVTHNGGHLWIGQAGVQ